MGTYLETQKVLNFKEFQKLYPDHDILDIQECTQPFMDVRILKKNWILNVKLHKTPPLRHVESFEFQENHLIVHYNDRFRVYSLPNLIEVNYLNNHSSGWICYQNKVYFFIFATIWIWNIHEKHKKKLHKFNQSIYRMFRIQNILYVQVSGQASITYQFDLNNNTQNTQIQHHGRIQIHGKYKSRYYNMILDIYLNRGDIQSIQPCVLSTRCTGDFIIHPSGYCILRQGMNIMVIDIETNATTFNQRWNIEMCQLSLIQDTNYITLGSQILELHEGELHKIKKLPNLNRIVKSHPTQKILVGSGNRGLNLYVADFGLGS